jgi:hypothetical protein
MTVKINADTSDGLKFVSDTSGTVDIQSNGTTVQQVTSSSIVGKQDIILDAGKEFCINAADDVHIGRATTDRMTFNTGGTEAARIDENQDLMVGTAVNINSSGGPFHVKSRNGSEHVASFQNGTSDGGFGINFYNVAGSEVGSIRWTASVTNFNTSSDYRLKENVDYSFDATSRLKQLKPCRFNWISDDTNTLLDGFLAHEVSNIVPEAVMGTKDGTKTQDTFNENGDVTGSETVPDYQSVDQSKLVPLLVKTIQELEARITALESE